MAKQLKVILLGDSGVGKTSIINRFVNDSFEEPFNATIGAQFTNINREIDGEDVQFNIWDTAGQERYRALAQMYYREADVMILVYDITNRRSFENLHRWIQELEQKGPEKFLLAITGNKEDLIKDEAVSFQEARNYAFSNKALYFRTSAKSNYGINLLFKQISQTAPASRNPSLRNSVAISEQAEVQSSKCSC